MSKHTQWVNVIHPDLENVGRVPALSLPAWLAIGYEVVDDVAPIRQPKVDELPYDGEEPEWTAQGASEQEGDTEPDADEESMS